HNPANPEVHRRTTARELYAQLSRLERPGCDAFISAVGTGGTVTGVGEVFADLLPHCKMIAVEPAGSPLISGGAGGPHQVQGIGAGFVPDNLNRKILSDVAQVADRDAYETKVQLAKKEGLLVGISSGANVFVALKVARELGAGRRVVTVLCDTGERYFSLD